MMYISLLNHCYIKLFSFIYITRTGIEPVTPP